MVNARVSKKFRKLQADMSEDERRDFEHTIVAMLTSAETPDSATIRVGDKTYTISTNSLLAEANAAH